MNDICRNICPCSDCSTDVNNCVLAKAYEKQIPKQAIETQELLDIEFICPECHCNNGERFNHCWNCGQKLRHIEYLLP